MDIFDSYTTVLTSAVADAGTVTLAYKDNRDAGSFAAFGHKAVVSGANLSSPGGFTVAFGTASITVTNTSGATWPAGTITIGLLRHGDPFDTLETDRARTMVPLELNLGAPDAIDVDAIFESFSGAAGAITLDGALVDAETGYAVLDVPRNLIADSGGADTAVLTITGLDEYGVVMVENITLNGTTAVPGKKAFKIVTGVTSSATISNGAFLGTGDVLGLPVFVSAAGDVLKELEDGAVPTAGTLVAGVLTEATATTGDVRGTYDPNSACNAAKKFDLRVLVPDPNFKGIPQFAG